LVTVCVGSRVCHGEDSGSGESEVGVDLVFAVVIHTHARTQRIYVLVLEIWSGLLAWVLLTIFDRICSFLLGRYQ